jgi:hypothetical protein
MSNPAVLQGNAFDIPLELRANDVTRHIINIDSRFRTNPSASSTSNFYYRLQAPVRNILRIRITSIEFPNSYLLFTKKRSNVTIRIIYNQVAPQTFIITIPDGNYTAYEMVDAINAILTPGLSWLSGAFDPLSGRFTFTGNQYFAVDTTYESICRPFDYGLGYYLGFSRKSHLAVGAVTTWTVSSDQCASFAGDNYVFLKVNDFDCVSQQTDEQTFTALAKIVLREPKNYMAFDDYASQHAKEVVFPNPQDLTRFHIQLLDAYGDIMDLCSSQISFSLEVLEVKNLTLYNTIRDSISLRYV